MVVDDNIDAAETLSCLLELQGHDVTVRTHPLDALGAERQLIAEGTPPEVFILDIGLPEMDGYELARRLRAELPPHPVTFIALTGYGQAHDRVLSQAAGFDHHFVKPMDIDALARVLAHVPH
jgi:CheY-like chemotaxis protein